MTTIQKESYWEAANDIKTLIKDHWLEVALYKDQRPLEPDMARYTAAENQGRLCIITARDKGELVGYSVFLMHHHLHYKSWLVASNDVVYVKPDRRGFVGARLIMRSEELIKAMKAKYITYHIKELHDWSPVLKRLGYRIEEIIMGKPLGEDHGI